MYIIFTCYQKRWPGKLLLFQCKQKQYYSYYNNKFFFLQKMKSSLPSNFIEQFPHLKSQWRPVFKPNQPLYFENIYSEDLCQIENVYKISMKELDLYSLRQAYSFPFCPKIYKYRIQKNYFEESQIKFDVKMLIETVPFRLGKGLTSSETHMLSKNILSIVKGFEYLHKRYGKFVLKQNMIGWTNLNLVKVWFNEDFASNKIEFPAASEQEMIDELIKILYSNKIKKMAVGTAIKTFEALIAQISKADSKFTTNILQPLQFNQKQKHKLCFDTIFEYQCKQNKLLQPKTTKSRKNTTFSFSSKDILSKQINKSSKTNNYFKRNSIKINGFQQRQIQIYDQSKSFHKKQASINNDSQISSLKMIINKQDKNKSFFYMNKSNSKSRDQNSFAFSQKEDQKRKGVNVNSNQNSVLQVRLAHRSSFEEHLNHFRHSKLEKPQFLHYSTSTNPCNKFKDSKKDKSLEVTNNFPSKADKQNNVLNTLSTQLIKPDSTPDQEPKVSLFNTNTFQLDVERLLMDQAEENHLKSSQQIKDDLDALFNSTNEFDASLLERQLDKVLFESPKRV